MTYADARDSMYLKVYRDENGDDYSDRLNGGFGNLGVFEPRESVKGDIARAVFYFYTMYRDEANAEDPDYFELMSEQLQQWHINDPVDSLEYVRNFRKADFQGGKLNPFILDCTLVSRAYGDGEQIDCGNTFTSITDISGGFRAYPKPVSDMLHLESELDFDEIKIYSELGHLISSQTGANEIGTSNLVSGKYYLQIIINGRRIDGFTFIKN